MCECYEGEYEETQELTPQQKELQEECANCERWAILEEHACATKCTIFQALTKKE